MREVSPVEAVARRMSLEGLGDKCGSVIIPVCYLFVQYENYTHFKIRTAHSWSRSGMMSVDETLMCSFQILKPSEKKAKYQYGGLNAGRPVTPPRANPKQPKK